MNEGLRLSDIAGYCPEKAIWKMMVDLTDQLLDHESEFRMAPGTIMVAGDSFLILSSKVKGDAFMAPEGQESQQASPAEMVWTIGALIYYASTGRILFGGFGGSYQRLHPGASLPVLPKSHQKLTPVMQQCLRIEPSERIKMEELNGQAKKGLSDCSKRKREVQHSRTAADTVDDKTQGKWPEEMKGI